MPIMGFGLILADTGLMNVIVTIFDFCVLWPFSVLETVFMWSSNSVGSYILSTMILKKTTNYIEMLRVGMVMLKSSFSVL